MLRSVSLFAVLVPVGLALFACTPDTKSTDDTGAAGDDTASSGDDTGNGNVQNTTIYDIQTGAVAEGSDVELKGLIVTSPVTPDGDGFFVQDAGGGEYSGMYIYMQSGLSDLYIGAGDEIDLIGYTTEYYDWTEVTVTAEANIQVVGEGDVTVDVVDPSSVSDWEVWESCLISTGAVTVESVDSYGEALIDGGVEINDMFFELDTEAGATYTDVIGAVSYEYSEWKINPRTEDDLVGYSAGPEAPAATVKDVQTGKVAEGDSVKVEDVVVTTPLEEDGFYVQDPGGGAYSGVYVYVYGGTDGLSISQGDTVTLEGTATEYYDLTEISIQPEDVEVTGTGAVTVDGVDPATTSDWEPWEGCMINIGGASLTKSNGYGDYYLDNGLLMDNVFMSFDDGLEGTSYSDISGALFYSYSEWRILPRSDADLVD